MDAIFYGIANYKKERIIIHAIQPCEERSVWWILCFPAHAQARGFARGSCQEFLFKKKRKILLFMIALIFVVVKFYGATQFDMEAERRFSAIMPWVEQWVEVSSFNGSKRSQ